MRKRIKTKLNKRGFSLVELLAVIVIVGALSVLAIAGVTRYIDGAKKEKVSQNKKSVSMAAQLYLQANRELFPKLIGDDTRVGIADLKNKNYLKENITNEDGESCMENSFVRVYKLNEGEYSYTTYLYCGDDEVPAEVEVPKPVVTNFKFTGGSQNASGNFNDVKDAKFSFTMKGSSDDDSIGIYSYSYSIYVKATNNPDDAYTQVFDSESIKGGFEPTISVTSKNLSSYISLTGFSNIRVDVSVINEQGGKTDFSNIEGNYEDKQNPICGTIEGAANDDNDWINKVSFGNKDVIASGSSRTYPARISVDCSDGFGSGCKRDRFTRSWPNDYDSVSGIDYNLGVRWSYITLEDNTNNTTKCYVRANVDLQSPEVKVTFYKINENGSRGDQVLTKTVKDQDVANATMPSLVINANEFADVTGTTDEKWMNKAKYPYGIMMDVEIKDNLYLYSYSWKTNNSLVGGGTGNSAIASSASLDNSQSEQGNGTANYGTFKSNGMTDNPTNDTELATAEHGLQSGTVKGLKIVNEGKRYGELAVCDKAGNCTYVKIYANLDRTAPPVPTATYYKGNSSQKTYAPAPNTSEETKYWTNTDVSAVILNQRVDYISPRVTDLSGWNKFTYRLGEQNPNARNSFKADEKKDVTQTFTNNGLGYKLTKEGIHKIAFRSCDRAGNCSAYSTDAYVKIDKTKPTCDVAVKYSPAGTKPNSAKWLKNGESATLSHTCSDPNVYSSGCDANNADNKKTYTYSTDIETTTAGVDGNNLGGHVWDYAGNESSECPKTTVKIDTVKPTCRVVPTYKGTKAPNANGWLKKGQSVTLSLSCTDPQATGGVKSGCNKDHKNNKRTYEYKTDILDEQAGAFGPNNASGGGTVFDIAGNESNACGTTAVRIDTVAPTCTTAISYPNGNPTGSGTNKWLGKHGTSNKAKTAVVKQVCTDNSASNGATFSDCDASSINSYTYNKEINTTKAGAGGDNNSGGKVKDLAGNQSSDCPKDKTVRIDYTDPTCTTKATVGSLTGAEYKGEWTNQRVYIIAQCTENGSYQSGCTTNLYDSYYSDLKNFTVHFNYDNTTNARATDVAGNYKNCNKDVVLNIDITPPTAKCKVTGYYTKDSNQKFAVDDTGTEDTVSDIKSKTYSLEGGSYTTTKTKNLTCGSSARNATAKMKVVDKAGNSSSVDCTGKVYVPACCDSVGSWQETGCSASCGGGTKTWYQLSNYNNSKCNAYSASCNTQSCCSSSNYRGCPSATACRDGNTFVFADYGFDIYAGVVSHWTNNWSYTSALYIIWNDGYKAYVKADWLNEDYGYGKYVYIYSKCLGGISYACPYYQCPG